MTDSEKIKVLAEMDGWTKMLTPEQTGDRCCVGYPPNHPLSNYICCKPYLTSYDAILPLIEKQPPAVLVETCRQLLEILQDYWMQYDKGVDWSSQIMCMMALMQAKPSQLCEGLIKSTGKWKD